MTARAILKTMTLTQPSVGNLFVTYVDWDGYLKIYEAMTPNRVRITYDRGRLELMSPSPEHERLKSQLACVLDAVFVALNIDFVKGGSTTFKNQLLDRGFEPDECYWLTRFEVVANVENIDSETGPFPDLGIEVDVTNSSANRMAIYAAFQVSELWRYGQDRVLRCFELKDGVYQERERSCFLPSLTMAELQAFVEEGRDLLTSQLIRKAGEWARNKREAT